MSFCFVEHFSVVYLKKTIVDCISYPCVLKLVLIPKIFGKSKGRHSASKLNGNVLMLM